MPFSGKVTRRNVVKAGVSALAGVPVFASSAAHAAVRPKKANETRVVYLGGDQLHNGFGQEISLRYTFKDTGWTIASTTDARNVTPELLKTADLLMITRWGGPILGWEFGPLIYERPSLLDRDDTYLSAELEDAIVDNVKTRGMGFMAFHCTTWSPDYKKLNEMMGIEGIMHGPVQDVRLHSFNQAHPITRGYTDYVMPVDENFGVKLTGPKSLKLFESTGVQDKRNDIAGWVNEYGNGRVVGLVAGHTNTAWTDAAYMELRWRGAHWAMQRDIPPYARPTESWF